MLRNKSAFSRGAFSSKSNGSAGPILRSPNLTGLFKLEDQDSVEISWSYSGDESLDGFKYEIWGRMNDGDWEKYSDIDAYAYNAQLGYPDPYGLLEIRLRAVSANEGEGAWSNVLRINIIVIEAPNGSNAGEEFIANGGAYAVPSVDGYVPAINNDIPAVQVYQFVINGAPSGDWFTSPTVLGNVVFGDSIRVRDISGNLSNIIIAESSPEMAAWHSRLATAGQSMASSGYTEGQSKAIFDHLYNDLQSAGIWSKIEDMATLAGLATFAGCQIKIKDGTGGVTPSLILNGAAPTYNANGALIGSAGNGTSTFLDTGYRPTGTDVHAYGLRARPVTNPTGLGGLVSGEPDNIANDASFQLNSGGSSTRTPSLTATYAPGSYGGPGISVISGTTTIYLNGMPAATLSGSIPSDCTNKIFGCRRNSAQRYTSDRGILYTSGKGLTRVEMLALHLAADRFARAFDPSRAQYIAFLGDSITKGTGSSPEFTDRYTKKVADGLGYYELNYGIPSRRLRGSTANLTSLFSTRVENTSAENVVVYVQTIGTNDVSVDDIGGANGAAFQSNYQDSLQEAVNKFGASKCFVCTIPYRRSVDASARPTLLADYNSRIATVASNLGVTLINTYQAMVDNGGDSLMQDGVHPNSAGHQVIADAILAVI